MKHLRTVFLLTLLALLLSLPAAALEAPAVAAAQEAAPEASAQPEAIDPLVILLPALVIAALCGGVGYRILSKRMK